MPKTHKDIKLLIGERVRELREARGITSQEKLGELASEHMKTYAIVQALATAFRVLEIPFGKAGFQT